MNYKAPDNSLHFLDDDAFAHLLPAGCAPITEAEASALRQAPTQTPDQIKASQWQAIKTERDRRIQSSGYKVGANWFHSDTFSRTQQIGLVLLGSNIPANTPWKTMGGAFVIMTPALAGQIFGAAAMSDIAVFTVAEQKKAAMEASADPASYAFLAGWPLGYSE